MTELGKDGWLIKGSAWHDDEVRHEKKDGDSDRMPMKTVMVYWMDQTNMRKEPIGILTERRKLERENNNVIGMLRLARKEFAKTEEEAGRIIIGDYV